MASKKPTRPVLRSTAPDVASALNALDDPKPPVVTTPVRTDTGRRPFAEEDAIAAHGRLQPEPNAEPTSTTTRTQPTHNAVALTRFEPTTTTPAAKPPNRTANLSASIAAELRDRIDAIAYEQKLGKTAIVEGALSMLFEGRSNAEIAAALRARGQAFRRRS